MENKPLLNTNIRWFLAGMVLANIAGQMAYSTLSLYMLDLGASVTQVGLVYTLASLVPMVLQIFGGWLSDTIGRLRVIAFGSSVAVFGYFIFSIAPSWEWILLGLSVEFVSNSVVGPSFNAYISEQSDESQRGRVYGLTSSIYMTVTVIGPALAGFLAYRFGFKPMMSVAFAFYLSATLLRIWMAIREHFEKKGAELPKFSDFKIQIKGIFALLFSGGVLTCIWVTDAVGDTSYNLVGELFPIYLSRVGSLNVEQIGWVNSARGLAIIAASFAAGWLVDKISERAVIVGGFLLQGIAIVSILYADNYAAFITSMLIFGLGTAGLIPAYESLISKVVPESKRGLAFGFFGTTLGILSLPMPWLGAQMWERFTPQTPFWFSVIACLISMPIAWFKFVIKDNQLVDTQINNGLP
jgi:MFS family permease